MKRILSSTVSSALTVAAAVGMLAAPSSAAAAPAMSAPPTRAVAAMPSIGFLPCVWSRGGAVNIRSGPGTGYRIVGVLYAGYNAPWQGGTVRSWYPIDWYGRTAYVSTGVTYADTFCSYRPMVG